MRHELKTWPEFFSPIWAGIKCAEVRRDDRGFNCGDELILREWDPKAKDYTDREIGARVLHVLRDIPGLEPGYCCLSIDQRWRAEPDDRSEESDQ